MPILATFVGGLFASIASFFGAWMAKKTAFAAAAISTFGILTVGLMAAMSAAIAGISSVGALPQWVLWGFQYFMPSNLQACISAIIAGHVSVAVYRWNVENLKLASYIT